jgi:predicted transcriptional regulator
VSPATKAKRTYRAAQKAKRIGQYVVEVPADEDAKNSVYAVAKAIRDDKDNTANIRSIVLSVVSSPTMLELVKLLSASEADALSVIALIERGDLDKATAIHAALPTLLGDIAGSVDVKPQLVSVLDCLLQHAAAITESSANGLLEAAVVASSSPEILKFIEVRQRGGLRARLLGWALRGLH